MKQMKTMLAGLVICTAFITACNKASYNDVVPQSANTAPAQTKIVDNNSVLFTSGTLNAHFVRVRSRGDLLVEFQDLRSWDLFGVLANTGLPLPPNKYPDLETTIDIAPSDGQPGLMLRGTWPLIDEAGNTSGTIPVNFVIDVPHRLIATSAVATLTEDTKLLSLLNINAEHLTAGIPEDRMRSAVDPGTGSILISDKSNPDLYQLLLKNLGEMLQILPAGTTSNPANTLDAKALVIDQQ